MTARRGLLTVPLFRSIAEPQTWAGLPPAYGCLTLVMTGVLALVMQMEVSAFVLCASLWGLGFAITRYDPWAWTLIWRVNFVPKVIKASDGGDWRCARRKRSRAADRAVTALVVLAPALAVAVVLTVAILAAIALANNA